MLFRVYRYTTITTISMLVLLAYIFTFDIELFEMLVDASQRMEAYELDELLIPAFLISLALAFDIYRRNKHIKLQNEKLKIYRSMTHASHHILNNFLNQMQLFHLEAERSPYFDPNMLALYDKVSKSAAMQIQKLSELESITSERILEFIKNTES